MIFAGYVSEGQFTIGKLQHTVQRIGKPVCFVYDVDRKKERRR